MISLDRAGWTWTDGPSLGPFDARIDAKRVLITGASGCGKSTLLKRIAGLLERHGSGMSSGEVTVDGATPARLRPALRAARIGFVPQSPADQMVAGTVTDEVAFGLHTTDWPLETRDARVRDVLELVRLDHLAERDPRTLSGGQLQRLAIAAALAPAPPLLLLDEPLAWLDPAAAADVLAVLADLPIAVLLAEHRVEACWGWVEEVLVVGPAGIEHRGPPDDATLAALGGRGLEVPSLLAFQARAAIPGPPPTPRPPAGAIALQIHNVSHSYGSVPALHGVDLAIHAGERVAVVGRNGSGKSTLLARLSEQPGTLAVPQDPDLALFSATVADELAFGPSQRGIPFDPLPALEALRLADHADKPPHSLSRGQRLRVAVGAAWACNPVILLLDEPTAGQDRGAVSAVFDALEGFAGAVVFATHDVGLALRRAHRIVVLDEGRVAFDGTPEAFLANPLLPVPPLSAWAHEAGVDLAWADARAQGA
ncbi:MAG: energy-coupling factor transporter ATP-binding protein EcfA2 [Myxococcota bacterium]